MSLIPKTSISQKPDIQNFGEDISSVALVL